MKPIKSQQCKNDGLLCTVKAALVLHRHLVLEYAKHICKRKLAVDDLYYGNIQTVLHIKLHIFCDLRNEYHHQQQNYIKTARMLILL